MLPTKRWRVELWFRAPSIREPHLIEVREFRFRIFAVVFAWRNEAWSNWRSIQPKIVDQHA